jgi:hypothetical protein
MCCGFAVKTRASEKNRSSFRLAIFLCSPTDRFHAPFPAKPGHISQSPRSVLGTMCLNISIGIWDGAGAGENQRFMALEVVGTRMEPVLHYAAALHKFLFPVQKVSNGYVCAFPQRPADAVGDPMGRHFKGHLLPPGRLSSVDNRVARRQTSSPRTKMAAAKVSMTIAAPDDPQRAPAN